jgi:hypothetical protein
MDGGPSKGDVLSQETKKSIADVSDIGTVRWRVAVEGVSYEAYARSLTLTVSPLVRRTLMWRFRMAVVPLLSVAALCLSAIYYWDVSGFLYLVSPELARPYTLQLPSVLVSYEVFGLTILVLYRIYHGAYNRRIIRLLHEEGQMEKAKRELLWGDQGLLIQSPDMCQRLPWTMIVGFVLIKDTWFLRTKGAGTLPIPARILDKMHDGAALIAFIKDKITEKPLGGYA